MTPEQLNDAEQKLRDEIKRLESLIKDQAKTLPVPKGMVDLDNCYWCELCQGLHNNDFKCEPLPCIRL